jgi:hypothetical protein
MMNWKVSGRKPWSCTRDILGFILKKKTEEDQDQYLAKCEISEDGGPETS